MLSEGQFQKLTADGAVDPIPGQEQAQEKSLEQLPLEAPGIPAPGPGSALRGSGSLSLGHTLHGSSLALGKKAPGMGDSRVGSMVVQTCTDTCTWDTQVPPLPAHTGGGTCLRGFPWVSAGTQTLCVCSMRVRVHT